MDRAEIIGYIKEKKGVEIAELQREKGITYREAKSVVDELVANGELAYAEGVRYSYVGKPEVFKEERKPFYERRLSSYFRQTDDDDENDDDLDDLDELLHEEFPDEDEESASDNEELEKLNKRFSATLAAITGTNKAPVSADVMPVHPSWANEAEFDDAVSERIERLIKSDRKMGVQGAVKKAEICLEAVRDTYDRKMMQVYERVVYELLNTSAYAYTRLKKQIFED